MKTKILFSFLSVVILFASCKGKKEDKPSLTENSKRLEWNNRYQVFDEPNSHGVEGMKFYLLLVTEPSMDTMRILSIRQDSNTIEGFYKEVLYEQRPASFGQEFDSSSFSFSTIRFVPTQGAIDSIRSIIRNGNLVSLKDTVRSNATGGTIKDMVMYDNGVFLNKYRSYVFDNRLEPGFFDAFSAIMKMKPPQPKPFYQR